MLDDERHRSGRDGAADRGPGRGALPRQPVERARRRAAEALRRLLRHLRPRQRRRRRPGAAAERAAPTARSTCPTSWPATSRRWCTRPSAYARQKDRLQTWACTASVGPGSTNMLTGAALATINRLPVLLLPSGTFATRRRSPVLQELEQPYAADVTVNDAFRPLSRFFDRVSRPEQLPSALLGAMRVLTDPVETGAVTIALPQDVQAEAHDWPVELFAPRMWRVARPLPEAVDVADAAAVIRVGEAAARRRRRRRALLRRRGGAARVLRGRPASRSARRQAGKGSLPHGHPQEMGAVGSTGTTAANALAAEADVVIGIGTRWSDFTTASRTAFQDNGVRFVNINVARFDAGKHAGLVGRRRRPRGAHRADRRPRRVCRRRRLPVAPGRAVGRVGRLGRGGLPPGRRGHRQAGRRAAHPGPGARRRQRADRPARRRALRGRLDARRPPQAVAGARPQGVPRRVRLLLHGLRGAGVARHPARRRVARRLRDGRRRRLPHDADRARHRRAGAASRSSSSSCRTTASTRSARCRSRSARSASARATASAASRPGASTATCCPSTSPPTRARSARTSSRCTRSTSCTRRSRRPRPRRPTADPSSSTSRPTRSCTRPTARRGGTCRSRRSATSTRRRRHTREYVDHKATQRPLIAPAAAPDRADPGVLVMKLALDPYMFRETPLLELPSLVAELGYEWIELSPRDDFIPFFNHPRVDDAGVAAFRKALAVGGRRRLVGAAALPVVGSRRGGPAGGGALLDARHPDRQRPRRRHDELRVQRQPARGGRRASGCSGARWRSCCPSSRRRGSGSCSSRTPTTGRRTASAPSTSSSGINSPNVSFLYCAPHTFHQGNDCDGIMDKAGDLLTMVHVADAYDHTASSGLRYIVNPPGSQVTVHQHLDIGQGEVDFEPVLRRPRAHRLRRHRHLVRLRLGGPRPRVEHLHARHHPLLPRQVGHPAHARLTLKPATRHTPEPACKRRKPS